MKSRLTFKKCVVWSLIAAISNPAAMGPAFARDSDIFLAAGAASTIGEPNVLIILDTSDSMNNPEGWREYPGAYDSHVEYLWNDTSYIFSIGCNVGSCGSGDAYTNASKNLVTPPDGTPGKIVQGYFQGGTMAERVAIKQAAINYATAIDPLDTGLTASFNTRQHVRNYGGGVTATFGGNTADASWIYWLPAGTSEDDSRLRSNSFNRWRGHVASISGSRGEITYPATAEFRNMNACSTMPSQMLPSTVYAPLNLARNTGKYLNQQWQRWNPYLDLTSVGTYPVADPTGGSAQTIIAGSGVGTVGNSITPRPDFLAGNTDNIGANESFSGGATPGSQGQPVVVNGGSARAGWENLRPDLAGFIYQSVSNSIVGSNFALMKDILEVSYGQSGVTNLNARVKAWGNANTGTRGYYDEAVFASDVSLAGVVTVPAGAARAHGLVNGNIVMIPGAGAGGTMHYAAITSAPPVAGVAGTFTISPVPVIAVSNVLISRNLRLGTAGAGPSMVCVPDTTGRSLITDGPDLSGVTRRFYYPTITQCVYSSGPNLGACPAPVFPSQSIYVAGRRTYSGVCAWQNRQFFHNESPSQDFYYSTGPGQCTGGTCTATGTATGTCPTPVCNVGNSPALTAGPTVNFGITMYDWQVGGTATSNCSNRPNVDLTQTCTFRHSGGVGSVDNLYPSCLYGANATGLPTCPSVAPPAAATTDYRVFMIQATTTNFVHDCKSDNGTAGNPSSGYITNATDRFFSTAWNGTTSDAGVTAPYRTTDPGATYPAIDMYSVNYLNWKFGPKSNNNPIGRKTRLQIAKDALANLVQNTNSVRFGLEVFNKTPTADPSVLGGEGGNIARAVRRMGSNAADPDFANRGQLVSAIDNVVATSTTPLTEALYEAYLYFSGRLPKFGTLTTPAPGGTVSDGRDTTAICTAIGAGTGCTAIGNYKSPMLNNPDVGPKGAPHPTIPGQTLRGPASCQKNFVIMITDGGPDRDVSANTEVKALEWTSSGIKIATRTDLDSAGPSTTSTQFEAAPSTPYGPISPLDAAVDGGYIWLDELAYFMSNADMSPGAPNTAAEAGVLTDAVLLGRQTVRTYTVGFAGGNSPVLQNAAAKGGGAYYIAEDSNALSAALTDALIKIKEFNPTVAAPSVPISALNRSENALDIYLAFFKPDTTQVWDGTVKRFRLGISEAECGPGVGLCLTGKAPVSTGYLNVEKPEVDGAVVDPTAISYWANIQDGSKPDIGGSGQQVISNTAPPASFTPATRKVYTWLSGVSTSGDLTVAANAASESNTYTSTNTTGKITKAMLGLADNATTDTTALTLINYLRGGSMGVFDCTDGNPSTPCNAWRAWAHADVQHSRPAVVTYDPTQVPDAEVPALQQPATRATAQYLYYLSNDGLLHALDAATGKEQWVFAVEEAFSKLSALRTDADGQQIDVADGTPVVWIKDVDRDGKIEPGDGDKVYLYFGLRRGGRAYYAIDVTLKDQPFMLWKISNTAICGPASCTASTQFAELGYTWSTPYVGKLRKLGATVPALIFGGGYDPLQDAYPYVPNTAGTNNGDTMGRALFIVNGLDGSYVHGFGRGQSGDMSLTSASIDYSIPSDPAAFDIDADAQGFIDRVYVGDMGGSLWRFDVYTANEANWKGKRLANLSSDITFGVTDRRKILFAPTAAPQKFGAAGRFDAVYVGTGDREHPMKTQTTAPPTSDSVPPIPNDAFFMIKDPDWNINVPTTSVSYTVADLFSIPANDTDGVTEAELAASGGWYRVLDVNCTPHPVSGVVSCGEKVTGAPTIFANRLRFGTYTPTVETSACVPAGQGRLNEINGLTGAYLGLNGALTSTSVDRYHTAFIGRGYLSTGQFLVVNKKIYHVVFSSGGTAAVGAPGQNLLFGQDLGLIGAARKIYWYVEPEL